MGYEKGEILHRVDGSYIDDGSETYAGMELLWTTWRVERTTPKGAWLKCVEFHWKKERFALFVGPRWVSKTKDGALNQLIARKTRQINIVSHQLDVAKDTLAASRSFATHPASSTAAEGD